MEFLMRSTCARATIEAEEPFCSGAFLSKGLFKKSDADNCRLRNVQGRTASTGHQGCLQITS